jgi:hypothetical protein
MHFVTEDSKPETIESVRSYLHVPCFSSSPFLLPQVANRLVSKTRRSSNDSVLHRSSDRSQPHRIDRRGVRQADFIAGHRVGATFLCAGEVGRGLQCRLHDVHQRNL